MSEEPMKRECLPPNRPGLPCKRGSRAHGSGLHMGFGFVPPRLNHNPDECYAEDSHAGDVSSASLRNDPSPKDFL